jgi:hypothetical protein
MQILYKLGIDGAATLCTGHVSVSSRSSYKLQIGNLANLTINRGTRGHSICQVEVSASGRSLVQRSPTECDVSECDRETSQRITRPTRFVES